MQFSTIGKNIKLALKPESTMNPGIEYSQVRTYQSAKYDVYALDVWSTQYLRHGCEARCVTDYLDLTPPFGTIICFFLLWI